MLTVDKLTIVQNALAATGNNVTAEPDDGHDEWEVASRAFDRAIPVLVARHDWKFATRTMLLTGLLSTSPSPRYHRAFQKPADCLHAIAVFTPTLSPPDTTDKLSEDGYVVNRMEIVADKICTNFPDPLTLKYLVIPDPEATHPLFVEALTLKVEAGCLRGLNEDEAGAMAREKMAEFILAEGRSRTDMQEPRRALRKSALRQSRFRRRA